MILRECHSLHHVKALELIYWIGLITYKDICMSKPLLALTPYVTLGETGSELFLHYKCSYQDDIFIM
jgi:hypothetical protein